MEELPVELQLSFGASIASADVSRREGRGGQRSREEKGMKRGTKRAQVSEEQRPEEDITD